MNQNPLNHQDTRPQSQRLTLVVLAAGIGSRYGGLKQVDPVGPGGEAVLDYAVFDARRADFARFIFVIRRDIEADFRATISRRFEKHLDLDYAFQELDRLPAGQTVPQGRVKPWGTGHAVLCAAPKVDGPFAVINADDFYGAQSYRVLAQFLAQSPVPTGDGRDAYAMVGFQLDRTLSEHGTVARGLCVADEHARLVSVEELTAIQRHPDGLCNQESDGTLRPLTGRETVSLNLWGFQPGLFRHLERLFAEFLETNRHGRTAEFYLTTAVNTLVQDGVATVAVLPTPCRWYGITYREDRPRFVKEIHALVRAGVYPERLWG